MTLIPCAACGEPVAIASQLERDDHEGVPLCESCGSQFHTSRDTALAHMRGRAARPVTRADRIASE
jgi:hypothetical protein